MLPRKTISARSIAFATLVLAVLACSTSARAITPAMWRLSFVGCPADGQLGPLAPPHSGQGPTTTNRSVAFHLAYYRGQSGPGVVAPIGWQCRTWYGSNGAFVIVSALPIDPNAHSAGTSPAVESFVRNGETSGRFEVAAVSKRFFPQLMRDYIKGIESEQPHPFGVTPYPTDRVLQITGRMIEFVTPAGREGFGTTALRVSELPIRGLVALSPPDTESAMYELFVRLPPSDYALEQSLLDIEQRCFATQEGC